MSYIIKYGKLTHLGSLILLAEKYKRFARRQFSNRKNPSGQVGMSTDPSRAKSRVSEHGH